MWFDKRPTIRTRLADRSIDLCDRDYVIFARKIREVIHHRRHHQMLLHKCTNTCACLQVQSVLHTHKVICTAYSVHEACLFAFIQIGSNTEYTALSFYSRRSRASVFILFWIQFYFLMLKNSLTHLTHIRLATQWECLEFSSCDQQ